MDGDGFDNVLAMFYNKINKNEPKLLHNSLTYLEIDVLY